jgi:hypothetical protein
LMVKPAEKPICRYDALMSQIKTRDVDI